MNTNSEGAGIRAGWFVGASYGGADDQTDKFLNEGVWEIQNPRERDVSLVKSMKPGDLIAIKSTYVRKHNLPFDNRGNHVSVMKIKAVGKIIENSGNGYRIKVDWHPDPSREWFFYTYRSTIWRVIPGDWEADALLKFAFEKKAQNLNQFRNAPFWRERFGDIAPDKQRFHWTRFYEAIANRLLEFKDNRKPLVAELHQLSKRVEGISKLQDQFKDGATGPLQDICPFTVMGIFNRGITDANRKAIAAGLAGFMGIEEPTPESFEGIPVLNNQNSWFFGFEKKRQPDDIDALWEVFAAAIRFVDTDAPKARSAFIAAYNNAAQRYLVGWNLTIGLYWIRPWSFPTLDGRSQVYIARKLGIKIDRNGPKGRCHADDYMTVLDTLQARFQENAYPVHSFPELSLEAWLFKDGGAPVPLEIPEEEQVGSEGSSPSEEVVTAAPIVPYSVDDILKDGCFINHSRIEKILDRLRTKKNIILQGPPGVGKTWLAKRLAFALMGQRDDSKLRAAQFHPNLSYEDFVRGWRPEGNGHLALVDGPFLEMAMAAAKAPSVKYVMVIEEINRGNPAQILGEMLTLIEADKRTPNEALALSYRRKDDERVFIPDNLYIIGTMNIADRSLALVDFALRRRFAFIDLEPAFGQPWQNWVHDRCGVGLEILQEIEKRMMALNQEISADTSLGPQFRVGHSYVTPPFNIPISDAREWFRQVVDTEIGPLLDEYWFDALHKAETTKKRLLEGFE